MVYNPFPWRDLLDHQVSRICVFDVSTGVSRVVHETDLGAAEAPNWTADGEWLVFNRDGELYRLRIADSYVEKIECGLELANNDHVLDPDGVHVYSSQNDGHIYRIPLTGGEPKRVTDDADGLAARYLHGVSPDGTTLTFIGGPELATLAPYNVYTLELRSGRLVQLTQAERRYDGAEFSPDGAWIYFNSELNATIVGHCQLYRMRPDGTEVQQLTFDDRVNWFPHPSPDFTRLAYLSYPPLTNGHPENLPVQVILTSDPLAKDVEARIDVFGGQGTINVPCWAPDSSAFAYVDYPLLGRQ